MEKMAIQLVAQKRDARTGLEIKNISILELDRVIL
jgi:hypothetical protein